MNTRTKFAPSHRVALGALVLAFAACIVSPARAGGPLDLVNHQPVVYANGGTNLQLSIDRGPLGLRTNAQAVALVQNAINLWNNVSTSTMRLSLGAALATDYDKSNYASIFNNFSDGFNPVIFDSDGSITDAIFGTGAKSNILGFAGSAYFTSGPSAGRYAEGRAVLNGALNISDASWTVVLAHEFGHFFGLDHSQIDSAQGMAPNNYVLMYPIAYRTLISLHEDDTAAVTALYPSAAASSVYGQLTGTFTTSAGTPILGANIWAKETSTGKVYSVVSDFLTQGNGYFRLLLPAGSYTLRAESIDNGFTGGSGVGPYSSASNDVSFQPPHPIAPVALGGSSPQQITITPGCVATAAFRLNGTGSVSGNCGSGPAAPAPTTTTLASTANPASVGAQHFRGVRRRRGQRRIDEQRVLASDQHDAAAADNELAGERSPGHRNLGGSQYGTALHVGGSGRRLEPQIQDQRGQRQREPLRAVRLAADDHRVRLPLQLAGQHRDVRVLLPQDGHVQCDVAQRDRLRRRHAHRDLQVR